MSMNTTRSCAIALLPALFPLAAMTAAEPLDGDSRKPSRTIYVDARRGDDTQDGLSPERALRTIAMGVTKIGSGHALVLRAGVYRETISLDAFQHSGLSDARTVISGMPGEERPLISGAVPVEDWQPHRGPVWKRSGWTIRSQLLLLDGRPLRQIGASGMPNDSFRGDRSGDNPGDLVPGSFFHAVNEETLYVRLPDDGPPAGRNLEASVLPRLLTFNFQGTEATRYIEIRGIDFRYANPSSADQFAAGVCLPFHSVMRDCSVRFCDFGGIEATTGCRIVDCDISDNGGIGIEFRGGQGGWLVQRCTVDRNNWRRFDSAHHAGGLKAIPDSWGTIEDSSFTDNHGSGVWFDFCRSGEPCIVRRCRIIGNRGGSEDAGIKFEGSRNLLAEGNLIVGNRGNGVLIFASDRSVVTGNTISANQGMAAIHVGGVPRPGTTLTGTRITGNIVAFNHSTFDLLLQQGPDDIVRDNVSDGNLWWRQGGVVQMSRGGTYIGDFGKLSASLSHWQETSGQDAHSLACDPRFADAGWTLLADSPCRTPIPVSEPTQPPMPAAIGAAPLSGSPVRLDPIRGDDAAWLDDHLPAGATPFMQRIWEQSNPVRYWDWRTDAPAPASGSVCIHLPSADRLHCVGFANATQALDVAPGSTLALSVWLDPADQPRALCFEFQSGDWEHRAMMGDGTMPPGVAGGPGHLQLGPLPASGRWHEVRMPAAALALDGRRITGFAVYADRGRAAFDRLRLVR